MLYYLIKYLEQLYELPLLEAMQLAGVRVVLAAITALVFSVFIGSIIIRWLRKYQLEEQVRENLIVNHTHKAGTPTMGGIIILCSIVSATILWGDIKQLYIWLILLATVAAGCLGFADDYIKTVKQNKKGLSVRAKLVGQALIGTAVGACLYFHSQVADVGSITYLPIMDDPFIDYAMIGTLGSVDLTGPVYIAVSVFVIVALSNSVNVTDGLDGLASGVTALVSLGLGLLAFVAGSPAWAHTTPFLFVPGAGELAVVAIAMAMACLGFLHYNAYPARIFMGDTGSLALGTAVGTIALITRVELILPILALVFFVEAGSVILQTSYFKYSRWKSGTGKRLFPIAPIHHSFENAGIEEPKIVRLFWAVALLGVLVTISIVMPDFLERLTYAGLFEM